MPPAEITNALLALKVMSPAITMDLAVVVEADLPLVVAEIKPCDVRPGGLEHIDLCSWSRQTGEH